jgi:hypothetical protein
MSKAKSRLRPEGWLGKRRKNRRITARGAANRRLFYRSKADKDEPTHEHFYHATKGYRRYALSNRAKHSPRESINGKT